MSDETEQAPGTEKKKSPLPAIGVAVGGMLGVTVAMMFVAPRVVASRSVQPPAEAHESPAESGGGGHGGEGGGGATGEFVELGNLLVNPADSRGLRFLMASITLEVLGDDGKSVNHLRQRDAQMRDLVISILEKYTLDDLTAVGARDTVKSQIAAAVDSTFGVHVAVFMPQFVIN